MAKTNYADVDQYLAAQPEPARRVLDRVRAAIRKALPDAEECISYQIPAYKINGKAVIFFAGWKDHFSLYPVGDALRESAGGLLDAYETSKGTLRVPLTGRAPIALIGRIAKLRAAAIAPARKLGA